MARPATGIPGQMSANSHDDSPETHGLQNLNAVRLIIVIMIGIGYASTMSIGPHAPELLRLFGYDPSWYGLQLLFFLSGWLAWRSLSQGRSIRDFLSSRIKRTLPWVALYTFFVAAILYPAFCDPNAPTELNPASLALYFFKTVSLIDPGGPMPGALDHAHYMCLFQGTVWSLRWGGIAYIGLLCFWSIGFRSRLAIASLFIVALASHLGGSAWTLQTGSDALAPLAPGFRLAYAFMLGATVYAFRSKLPSTAAGWLLISLFCLLLGGVQYFLLPWTHMVEVTTTIGLAALSLVLFYSRGLGLKDWPNLILPTYLGIWPITQTVLALNPNISVTMLIICALTFALTLALGIVFTLGLSRRGFHRRVQTA